MIITQEQSSNAKGKMIKICKLCGKEFLKDEVGRIRILKRMAKFEQALWICSMCSVKIKVDDE